VNADRYDALRDAVSDSRYEDDPRVEDDTVWREQLPESGCDG
jgi:hypothetical protein